MTVSFFLKPFVYLFQSKLSLMEMFAFNRSSDKLREEIILFGFQVRPKGRTEHNSPKYPKTWDFFTSKYAKMTSENLGLVLSQTKEVEERTANLRKWL